MRNQQEAEREEQQRIKDLVLNYERMEDQNDSDGTLRHRRLLPLLLILQLCIIAEKNILIAAYRYDKGSRNTQRTKKLTLQDVNW